MPAVSGKQFRAMEAAKHGTGTLGIPVDVAREFTQDGPPKKKTHRGRKPSGKPGASHLSALMKAHGAGDHKAAKTHALNYANSVHSATGMADQDEMGGQEDKLADDVMPVAPAAPATPKSAAFQALTMRKKK